MTWGDVGAFFAVLVVGSCIAVFVDAWLEQRKWDKKTKKGVGIRTPTPQSYTASNILEVKQCWLLATCAY